MSQEFFNNRIELFVRPVNREKRQIQNKSLTLKNCESGKEKTKVNTNHQSSFELFELICLSVNLFQFNFELNNMIRSL